MRPDIHPIAAARRISLTAVTALLVLAGLTPFGSAQQSLHGQTEVTVLPVQGSVHMIRGAGGNIAVQIGPDGLVLVDAGSADMAGQVLAALETLTPQPIRYIINTGPSADHVGGNERVAPLIRPINGTVRVRLQEVKRAGRMGSPVPLRSIDRAATCAARCLAESQKRNSRLILTMNTRPPRSAHRSAVWQAEDPEDEGA